MTDTIFALATVKGRSGVAVVRISGPLAFAAAERLAGSLPAERQARLRSLRDPSTGEVIDRALVLVFPDTGSFTGEKIVEFQIHGSLAVQNAVLQCLGNDPGLRLAEPGEFTRRAMENGRMDLSQVEGLADLIEAETDAQRRQAMRVMQGTLGALAGRWRSSLVRASALIETTIDFADEELPPDLLIEAKERTVEVLAEMRQQVRGAAAAERIREGFEVAIVGLPNAGKSTLLNRIAGREAAITSEVAGTTRDVIEVRMDIRGLPVTLLDTAGVRDTEDGLEALGVARTRARAEQADLRVFLRTEADEGLFYELSKPGDLFVRAKADIVEGSVDEGVSGLTGLGVDTLLNRIGDILSQRASGASDVIRLRHKLAMEAAISALESAVDQIDSGIEFAELAAEDYRRAIRHLDSLIGRVDVETLLDEIFASFCLGK